MADTSSIPPSASPLPRLLRLVLPLQQHFHNFQWSVSKTKAFIGDIQHPPSLECLKHGHHLRTREQRQVLNVHGLCPRGLLVSHETLLVPVASSGDSFAVCVHHSVHDPHSDLHTHPSGHEGESEPIIGWRVKK